MAGIFGGDGKEVSVTPLCCSPLLLDNTNPLRTGNKFFGQRQRGLLHVQKPITLKLFRVRILDGEMEVS